MTTYAYLRVSTDRQDDANQRHGILEYANAHSLGLIQFVEDALSGRVAWCKRAIGQLLTATAHLIAPLILLIASLPVIPEALTDKRERDRGVHLRPPPARRRFFTPVLQIGLRGGSLDVRSRPLQNSRRPTSRRRVNRGQMRAPHSVVRPQEPRARSYLGWTARRLTLGALGTLLLPLTSEVSLPLPPVAMLYSAPVLAAEEILIGPSLGYPREEHQRYRRMGTRGPDLVLVQSDGLRQLEQLQKQGRAPGISFDAQGRITITSHPNFNPDVARLIAEHQILAPAALQRVLEQSAARHTILMRMKGGDGIPGVHFTDPSLSEVRLWRPNANYTVQDDELLRSAGYVPLEDQLERSLAHAEVIELFHQGRLPNVHISEYHAVATVRPSTYYHGAARDAVERTGIYDPATFKDLARASDALIVLERDAVPGIMWNADGTIASFYTHPGYATYRSADGLSAHDLVVAARYGGPTADELHRASVQLADLHRQLDALGVKITFDPERPGAIHYEHKWWPEMPGEPERHERAKELVRRALGVEFSQPRPAEPSPLPPSRQLRLDAEELLWRTLRGAPPHR